MTATIGGSTGSGNSCTKGYVRTMLTSVSFIDPCPKICIFGIIYVEWIVVSGLWSVGTSGNIVLAGHCIEAIEFMEHN